MLRRLLPEIRRSELERPASLFDMMENFFKSSFDLPLFRSSEYPAVNISENEKEIKVEAELPGLEPKDIEISFQNGNLILKGEKKFKDEENKDNYHRIEISYGSFYRSIPIDAEIDIDKVKAKFKNGILEITLPKKESFQVKKIEIES